MSVQYMTGNILHLSGPVFCYISLMAYSRLLVTDLNGLNNTLAPLKYLPYSYIPIAN